MRRFNALLALSLIGCKKDGDKKEDKKEPTKAELCEKAFDNIMPLMMGEMKKMAAVFKTVKRDAEEPSDQACPTVVLSLGSPGASFASRPSTIPCFRYTSRRNSGA